MRQKYEKLFVVLVSVQLLLTGGVKSAKTVSQNKTLYRFFRAKQLKIQKHIDSGFANAIIGLIIKRLTIKLITREVFNMS